MIEFKKISLIPIIPVIGIKPKSKGIKQIKWNTLLIVPYHNMQIEYLTRKQVAEKLQVTTKTIDNYSKRGLIRKLKAGKGARAVRFEVAEIMKVFTKN